jgi:hypothetical protein
VRASSDQPRPARCAFDETARRRGGFEAQNARSYRSVRRYPTAPRGKAIACDPGRRHDLSFEPRRRLAEPHIK